METSVQALRLIVFTIEDHKPKTLLNDTLCYNPGYRVGDIIHLLRPTHQVQHSDTDYQFIVRTVKHIILADNADNKPNDHILLVDVDELSAYEREDLSTPFHATLY